MFPTRFSLAEILVMVGCSIPSAPAVPASTRISARLKQVQRHGLPVNTRLRPRVHPPNAAHHGPPLLKQTGSQHMWQTHFSPGTRGSATSTRATVMFPLKIKLQAQSRLFKLECVYPGSGQQIPAMWHCAGAYRRFDPRNIVLKTDNAACNTILSVTNP